MKKSKVPNKILTYFCEEARIYLRFYKGNIVNIWRLKIYIYLEEIDRNQNQRNEDKMKGKSRIHTNI